jgi:2-haloacid dehalogenase
MQLYLHLAAYPDAVACLKALKQAGFTTGILSNGSTDMLSAAVTSAGLDAHLDHVLSIEDVGIYKPDPKVYQLAVDRTDVGDARRNLLRVGQYVGCPGCQVVRLSGGAHKPLWPA